jgi:hypothetical protein
MPSTTISDTLSDRYSYLDDDRATVPTTRKRNTPARYPDVEAAIAQWMKDSQRASPLVVITSEAIRAKALQYFTELPQYHGLKTPTFSKGWFEKFKARKGIQSVNRHGEAASVDDASLLASMAQVRRQLSDFPLEDQYNCD